MSALGGTSFPVPKMYLFCEDKTIMGQEFYVMEYVKPACTVAAVRTLQPLHDQVKTSFSSMTRVV